MQIASSCGLWHTRPLLNSSEGPASSLFGFAAATQRVDLRVSGEIGLCCELSMYENSVISPISGCR